MRTIAAILSLLLTTSCFAADAKLVIHEWGTFTSLQDESGRSIGRINIDDEPLPDFVRTRDSSLIRNSPGFNDTFSKDVVPLHPDVTMRLETPVMYFYPPKDAKLPLTIDVAVDFHGGWLTQYYPGALATLPGFDTRQHAGKITEETTGNLTWKKLQVGTNAEGPKTDSKIWLAPRQVSAVGLTSVGGESEKYLFYRGVGHMDSPLRVSRSRHETEGEFLGIGQDLNFSEKAMRVTGIWLVDVAPSGAIAFRQLKPVWLAISAPHYLETTPANFDPTEFQPERAAELKSAMKAELISSGLFEDEAKAMLKTWEQAYFKSPGLRLFYIVPREWTDHYLPLKVSIPTDITRVMVGRIELVTPHQRDLIQMMTKADVTAELSARVHAELGRFAGAMLLDAQRPSREQKP